MIISYPFIVRDDSGALVSGAAVTVASVTDKAGAAITTPGAVVNIAGSNVTVDYDAETKGEAWITLAVSKNGSTFTGENAAPAIFASRDSGRVLFALPSLAAGAIGGVPILDSNLRSGARAETIAADALNATAISTTAITKIQNGLATGADATTIQNYVDTLETSAAAIQSAVAGLGTTNGNIQAAVGNVGSAVSALQTAVGVLQTSATKIDNQTDTVEAGIETIKGYTDTVEGGITNLQNTSSTIQGYVDTVESTLAALATAINALPANTVTALKNDPDTKLAKMLNSKQVLTASTETSRTFTCRDIDTDVVLGTVVLTIGDGEITARTPDLA